MLRIIIRAVLSENTGFERLERFEPFERLGTD
jgi:hypothetical protein